MVGAVLVGDAEYWKPMASWLPRGYAFLMWSFAHPMRRKLLRLAGIYTETLGDGGFSEFYNAYPSVRNGFGAPVFSRPDDDAMTVDGSEPTSYIDGFCEHAVLGDAVLHTE
ncbi:MAG: hypothetical protein SV760_09950, partial [Halobacteria archaeon]|nr:hypothetical protein [Halobacteria archaeon]